MKNMKASNNNSQRKFFNNNRTTTSKVPPYNILIPVAGFTGTVLYTYYYFQDEMPFTKRKRLLATSIEWEKKVGDREYRQQLHHYRGHILPSNHRASVTVERVGDRIAKAATNFANEHNVQTYGNKYTYTVVRSDMANAFVLPNNHVFVLSGLFNFVSNEDDLAAILGHEMAHNLARHTGERVSGSILISFLARCTLLIDPSGVLYSLVYPAATLLHDLPHSREHEIEADFIGLRLAADACYDPKAARKVFLAMKNGENGSDKSNSRKKPKAIVPPEFMSTHPSYDTRISNFDDWMPKAMEIYNADAGYKCQQIRRDMKLAREKAARLATSHELAAKR
jgi:predicted Zn-dependent protease